MSELDKGYLDIITTSRKIMVIHRQEYQDIPELDY